MVESLINCKRCQRRRRFCLARSVASCFPFPQTAFSDLALQQLKRVPNAGRFQPLRRWRLRTGWPRLSWIAIAQLCNGKELHVHVPLTRIFENTTGLVRTIFNFAQEYLQGFVTHTYRIWNSRKITWVGEKLWARWMLSGNNCWGRSSNNWWCKDYAHVLVTFYN